MTHRTQRTPCVKLMINYSTGAWGSIISMYSFDLFSYDKRNEYKTGVMNDPLGQPTVPAGSDCRLILKFWDRRTDTLCGYSDHYRPGL